MNDDWCSHGLDLAGNDVPDCAVVSGYRVWRHCAVLGRLSCTGAPPVGTKSWKRFPPPYWQKSHTANLHSHNHEQNFQCIEKTCKALFCDERFVKLRITNIIIIFITWIQMEWSLELITKCHTFIAIIFSCCLFVGLSAFS